MNTHIVLIIHRIYFEILFFDDLISHNEPLKIKNKDRLLLIQNERFIAYETNRTKVMRVNENIKYCW